MEDRDPSPLESVLDGEGKHLCSWQSQGCQFAEPQPWSAAEPHTCGGSAGYLSFSCYPWTEQPSYRSLQGAVRCVME